MAEELPSIASDNAHRVDSSQRCVRVTTGARLHFGLFDVQPPFGGVGLMIDRPETVVQVTHAEHFSIQPIMSPRLNEIGHRVAFHLHRSQLSAERPCCLINVASAADAHCGLGSGTQLSLAAAIAMTEYFRLQMTPQQLVRDIASRGKRSSIGSLGFFHGGLIIEDGEVADFANGTDWTGSTLPDAWRLVLARPARETLTIFGEVEQTAFAKLPPAPAAYRATLVKLAEDIARCGGLGDYDGFCHSVARFNAMSGELFAPHQGGCYNGAAVTQLIQRIESLGYVGVGQSSWGPTVFVVCKDEPQAERVVKELDDIDCQIARPCNRGYKIHKD